MKLSLKAPTHWHFNKQQLMLVVSIVGQFWSSKVDWGCDLPRSQGATHSSLSACLMMVSGRGRECLTMAPYRPYSAMMLPRPQVLLVFLSLALLFWNQT